MVGEVIHPALPGHPQNHIFKRDFSGSSGLFAFTFRDDPTEDQIAAFINSLDLFGIGYSWGGFKSLVTAGTFKRPEGSAYAGKTIIRLNIGLEDTEDIIRDLENGFGVMT